jgi:hypothetical protein
VTSREIVGKDGIKVNGAFTFRHFRAGNLIEDRSVRNLIVTTGKAGISGLIIQTGTTAPFSYLAIGEGTAGAASSDVALETEISTGGGERALAALTQVTTDVTNDTSQLVKTFAFNQAFTVTEAGVFNAASSGTMLCRQTFVGITIAPTDTLEVTYKLDVD